MRRIIDRDRPFLAPSQRFPIDYQSLIELSEIDSDGKELEEIDFGIPDAARRYISPSVARDVFEHTLRHISFEEFLTNLTEAANAFALAHAPEPYSLVVEGMNRCKSNFWVMELLIDPLGGGILGTKYRPSEIVSDVSEARYNLVMFPDDAMFTGNQMRETVLSSELSRRSSRRLSSIGEMTQHDRILSVVVAFTTNLAAQKFAERGVEVFYGDVINSMVEIASLVGPEHEAMFDEALANVSPQDALLLHRPAVYFDHKIPDDTSVPELVQLFVSGCQDKQQTSKQTQLDQRRAKRHRYRDYCPVPPYILTPSCLEQ